MASPIDVSVLSGFLRILVSILVFVFIFAVLKKTNLLGEKDKSPDSIYAIIALFIAIIFMFSNSAYVLLGSTTPWFAVFFIFAVLAIIPFMIIGATPEDVREVLYHERFSGQIRTWVIVIVIIIMVTGFVSIGDSNNEATQETNGDTGTSIQTSSGSGELNSSSADSFWVNFWQIIGHKKVLGVIVFLLICYFVVSYLTQPFGKN